MMSDPKIDSERMKQWKANILPVPSAERLKGKGSSPSACSADFVWRDLGDGNPVRVKKCSACGVAPSAVDDCGMPNPDCPYFGRNNSKQNVKNSRPD